MSEETREGQGIGGQTDGERERYQPLGYFEPNVGWVPPTPLPTAGTSLSESPVGHVARGLPLGRGPGAHACDAQERRVVETVEGDTSEFGSTVLLETEVFLWYNKLDMPEQAPILLHQHEPLRFPEGFLWGTATSAHQVEGNNKNNDWWKWEQKTGHLRSGQACESWQRYEEDFDLAKRMYNNAHRLSIEWSRVEPREGEFDEKVLAHYRQMLQAIHDRGMKVMLTLHHFTNPMWLTQQGSWTNKKSVFYFERYTHKIVETMGDLVDFWITINEPLVFIGQSYVVGVWPPEQKSYWQAFKIFKHMSKAHRHAYHLIHQIMLKTWGRVPEVGIANNVSSFYAYHKHSLTDQIFVQIFDWLFDHSFYTFTKGTHDFLGLNYYFHYRVTGANIGNVQNMLAVRREKRDMSDIGWEIYPQGIFEVLQDLQSYGKPIYITENGIATSNDDKRQRFLVSYLKEIYHAIQAGVDVRGYFHWSLLDNFEWEKGFTARFGLVEVDFATGERRPRQSFEIYRRICRENAINHDLMHLLGHAIHRVTSNQ